MVSLHPALFLFCFLQALTAAKELCRPSVFSVCSALYDPGETSFHIFRRLSQHVSIMLNTLDAKIYIKQET